MKAETRERIQAAAGPPWSPRRALLYRGGFLATMLVLAYLFRYGFGLALHPAIFLILLAWYLTFPLFFLWSGTRTDSRWFLPLRSIFYVYEIVLLVAAAHFLGGVTWLGMLLVLFATIEWNLQFDGGLGAAGSLFAVLALGALVLAEATGVVSHVWLFAPPGALHRDPAYVVSTYLVSAFVIVGVSLQAGNYAGAIRRRRLELEEVNRRLEEASADLRRSNAKLEGAYADLRAVQAQAVQSARLASLGMLVAGVAHELNTPLGAIHSNRDTLRRAAARLADLLAAGRLGPEELRQMQELVENVAGVIRVDDTAVDRIVGLVTHLRSFGRPDEAEGKVVDLHEGLESTLALLRHVIRDRIEIRREYGPLPAVECYSNQINQVFMNLLLNAAQAIRGRGTITLRTRLAGAQVVVEIEDTGVGIAPEHLDRIFDPGFTTKGSRVGMGLGLLISHQIVERHGGHIDVRSEVGRGSVFRVWLPLRLARTAAAPPGVGGSTG